MFAMFDRIGRSTQNRDIDIVDIDIGVNDTVLGIGIGIDNRVTVLPKVFGTPDGNAAFAQKNSNDSSSFESTNFSRCCKQLMYSQDLRWRACMLYYDRYQSVRKTADALLVGKSSVSRWLMEHPISRKIQLKQKQSEALVQKVTQALKAQPFHSIRTLHDLLRKEGFQVSRGTIHKCIRRIGWTYKKVSKLQLKSKKQNELEAEFLEKMSHLYGQNWVSIDETCIWSDFLPLRGYAPHSQRLLPLNKTMRGSRKKYSLLMAISRTGVIHTLCKEGSILGDDFARFLRTMPDLPPGTALVMDNASIHKTRDVKDAMNDRNVSPIYTAPYRPDWNPIEHTFSPFKHHFRSLHNHPGSLLQRVQAAIALMPQGSWENCFHAVESRLLLERPT